MEDAITDSLQPLKLLSHPIVSCLFSGYSCSVICVDRNPCSVYFDLLLFSGKTKDVGTILEVVQASNIDAWLVTGSSCVVGSIQHCCLC